MQKEGLQKGRWASSVGEGEAGVSPAWIAGCSTLALNHVQPQIMVLGRQGQARLHPPPAFSGTYDIINRKAMRHSACATDQALASLQMVTHMDVFCVCAKLSIVLSSHFDTDGCPSECYGEGALLCAGACSHA